jgi:hypothetical protein
MANFPRVNPGGWPANDPLTSAQTNQLDTNVSKCVNGDDGSDHTPAAPVRIDGPGGIESDKVVLDGECDLRDHAVLRFKRGTLTLAATSTAWPAATTHLFVTPYASGTGSLLLPAPASNAGAQLAVWVDGSVARAVLIRDSTDTSTLANFPLSTACSVTLICNAAGTAWHVHSWSGGPTSLAH